MASCAAKAWPSGPARRRIGHDAGLPLNAKHGPLRHASGAREGGPGQPRLQRLKFRCASSAGWPRPPSLESLEADEKSISVLAVAKGRVLAMLAPEGAARGCAPGSGAALARRCARRCPEDVSSEEMPDGPSHQGNGGG